MNRLAAICVYIFATVAFASDTGVVVERAANAVQIAKFLETPFVFVSPRVSTVGTPRTIHANGCEDGTSFDQSQLAAGKLIVKSVPAGLDVFGQPYPPRCVEPPKPFSFTPTVAGTLRVTLLRSNGAVLAETTMETVAAATAGANIDGPWYDPESNGSGISFHQSSNGTVFGTWFLFGDGFRHTWLSLQNLRWLDGGRLIAGDALYATGQPSYPATAPPDCKWANAGNLSGCVEPRTMSSVSVIGTAEIRVVDANALRAEMYDAYGRLVFVSQFLRMKF